jgi:hypothetical protein
MIIELSLKSDAFKNSPNNWIETARKIAEEELTVPAELEIELEKLDPPFIPNPNDVRKEFWKILALPKRDVALRWLDKFGIVGELLPCWGGLSVRRAIRLDAFANVSTGFWKEGLSDTVLATIDDVNNIVVDRRLDRWALTAFATLLAGGDTENQNAWAKSVRRDLHVFGATEAEIVWIERLVREFNHTLLYLRGEVDEYTVRPELAIACLSTLKATDPRKMAEAARRANDSILKNINPLDKE